VHRGRSRKEDRRDREICHTNHYRKGTEINGRVGSSDRSSFVPRRLDFVFGVGIWVTATGALVLVGNLVLPGADAGLAAVLAYVVVCAATFGATYTLAGVRTRLGGEPLNGATGLRFGAVVLVVGLFLDGLLLATASFAYPNVDAARTETIAVMFMLAYPLALVGPWLAGLRAEDRGH